MPACEHIYIKWSCIIVFLWSTKCYIYDYSIVISQKMIMIWFLNRTKWIMHVPSYTIITHRIHVWNIYLHENQKNHSWIAKYTYNRPMNGFPSNAWGWYPFIPLFTRFQKHPNGGDQRISDTINSIITPPKTNMDAKNDGLEKVVPFKYGHFLVSMNLC